MELVVISGKGGTGKTTITTALSELANNVVKADCDVDAPNLYLMYKGDNIEKFDFIGEKKAVIDKDLCIECGQCEQICRFDAISNNIINEYKCEGCGACVLGCPVNAIKLFDEKSAEVIVTKTDKGIISRAEMGIGSDGSGKLVTEVRKNAKRYSDDNVLTIVDGSPGIGCPVIASITGCDMALVVTEPTKSGLNDLKRILDVCKYFGTQAVVCINKYGINIESAEQIEKYCNENQYKIVGKIPYDDIVMKSINELKPIVYYKDSEANKAIRVMWNKIKEILNNNNI